MNRAQLIVGIVRRQIERGEVVRGSGTLEVLPDGYGFLRSAAHNYLACPEDIYVSPSQIRRMGLRTGLVVEGPIRLPIEGQDNFALMQVELVNGKPPDERTGVTSFEDLTPLHPNERLVLETTPDELSMRIVDLVTPIGKGQRGLIVVAAADRQDDPARRRWPSPSSRTIPSATSSCCSSTSGPRK